MRSLAVTLILGGSLLLGACKTLNPLAAPPEPSFVKRTLTGTEWVLVAVDGLPAPARAPTLTLTDVENEKRAVGFAGCNRFTGSYMTVGDALNLNGLASTRMACADMKVEQAYLDALQKTTRYRLDADVLELIQGNELRLRFKAKPVD